MKKILYQAVLNFLLLAAVVCPGLSFAASGEAQTGTLSAQIQEQGRIRIFDGQKEIGNFMPQIFLQGWKIIFFTEPGPGEKADAVAKLPDGAEILFSVSAKAGPFGLRVHGVMTPLKDTRVLSARATAYLFPYKDWDGDTYELGNRRATLPHTVTNNDGGVLATATAPLLLGPSHANGLTAKFTSKLPVTLQDVRQWTPGVSVFYTNDKPGGKVWNWKAGEKKTFDFTVSFNREIGLVKAKPPKSLETLRAQMDEVVKPYLDNGFCPGLAVGVLYQGQTKVWGYGTTSLKNGRIPDGDTEYEIGSITKLFTKLLFSDMVHQGQMSLDDRAQSYLPKGVTMPSKDGKEITLLMLSNHTSQLPHDPDDIHWDNPYRNPYENYSLDQLYSYLNRVKLTAVPGGDFQYSNTGVALLGDFVAQKKGIPWTDYLQKRVLDPVGLKDTGVTWTTDELSHAAQGYDTGMDPLPLWKWEKPTGVPAGSLHSTVNDLLKLAMAALDEGSPLADIAFDETAEKLDWGPIVTHAGGTSGFNTYFYLDRKQKITVVVLGNIPNGVPIEVAGKFRDLTKGYITRGFDLPAVITLPSDQLKPYVGRYRVVKVPSGWRALPWDDFSFYLKNGLLYVKAEKSWDHDIRIDPLANGDFYVKEQRFEFNFTKDGKGAVTGYTSADDPEYVVEKLGYKAPKSDDTIPPPP